MVLTDGAAIPAAPFFWYAAGFTFGRSGATVWAMPLPVIAHLDADAFFVSVEQACDPSLRGKKVAVGGRQRGIIASASYEARACGVYTPMATKLALQVCPDLILVSHTSGRYGQFSRRMFDLCGTLTPFVERSSIDEGYLDLSPCGCGTEAELVNRARGLQRRLWEELQIPVSLGLAANKLVAAIASKLLKPRGFVVVPPGTEAEFLAPLSVGVLPGIGKKSEAKLKAQGLTAVQDLLALNEEGWYALFGHSWRDIQAMARGEDDRPLKLEHDDAKSYSQQETFPHDVSDFAEIERIAKRMIDELMPKIRADGKKVRTMTVKVRYPGMEDSVAGRSLTEATDLEAPFYPLVELLLRRAWAKRRPLRLVSVRFSGVDDRPAQLEMFAQTEEKKRRLAAVLDKLNDRGRKAVVQHGHQLGKTTAD
ncbi:MAG: DNA polymerase IV [Opitutaceae bacterium]|nr:DNA polymerase IV [Opitutaceae bacterium]